MFLAPCRRASVILSMDIIGTLCQSNLWKRIAATVTTEILVRDWRSSQICCMAIGCKSSFPPRGPAFTKAIFWVIKNLSAGRTSLSAGEFNNASLRLFARSSGVPVSACSSDSASPECAVSDDDSVCTVGEISRFRLFFLRLTWGVSAGVGVEVVASFVPEIAEAEAASSRYCSYGSRATQIKKSLCFIDFFFGGELAWS